MAIQESHFVEAVLAALTESFERVEGIYLDKGNSLFETLSTISAGTASVPVGGKCATLAAQVKHTAFYMDVVERSVRTGQNERVDWDAIWRETRAVNEAEWRVLLAELRASYERIKKLVVETPAWASVDHISGAIGLVAHAAYHLGEIRQAMCTLQADGPRLVHLGAFAAVGPSIRVRGGSPEIGKLWDAFVPRISTIPNAATPMVSFGVMRNFDMSDGTMDYAACLKVTKVGELPPGMSAHEVPAQAYIAMDTTLPKLGAAFGFLNGEWLPKSEYMHSGGVTLERYGADFSPQQPNVTIFVPVKVRE